MAADIRDTPAVMLVLEKKFVVTASPNSTLEEALDAMKEVDVSGLPVFDPEEGFLGFVSVFDIMTYVALFSHFKDETLDHQAPSFAHLSNKVRDVLALSAENVSDMWKAFGTEETLGSIAGRMESGIHRMLIAVNDRAKLLTQTDVIKYIYNNDKKSPVMNLTVIESGIAHLGKEIASISDTATALQGFRIIYRKRVSAIAVLDKNGAVVATLSASDVRTIRAHNAEDILLPVLKFLEKHSAIRSQVAVTEGSKILDVFRRLVESHVHRVWVVDAARKPIGVLTMSDLIGLYFK